MDSLDVDAIWCYTTVAVVGLITALGQVNSHLQHRTGKWLIGGTWLLLSCYFAVPLGLFFLLDHTGAVHDTSLFAAILIATTYNRVLAGGAAAMPVPDQVSSWWPSFLTWADKVSKKVAHRDDVKEQRFTDRILDKVVGDDHKFTAFLEVALTHVVEPEEVTKSLAAIDLKVSNAKLSDELSERVKHKLKVRRLFELISELDDFQYKLRKQKVITRWDFARYGRKAQAWIPRIVVIGLMTTFVYFAVLIWEQPTYRASYDAWRISKPNSTRLDLHRARQRVARSSTDVQYREQVATKLARALVRPDLPVDRVAVVLQLLLETRPIEAEPDGELARLLVDALRTTNEDRRNRVHEVLLHLSNRWKLDVATLKEWKPATGDSVSDLDARIRQWRGVFSKQPSGK